MHEHFDSFFFSVSLENIRRRYIEKIGAKFIDNGMKQHVFSTSARPADQKSFDLWRRFVNFFWAER